jgi:thioredoxin-like negative regulator of GroEL
MTSHKLSAELIESLQRELSLDVARLLTQTALLAIRTSQMEAAQYIVDGLSLAFGDHTAVAIAKATLCAATGRYKEALTLVESQLAAHPDNTTIRCAQAMLRKELGLAGWQSAAQNLATDSDDAHVIEVAEQLLAGVSRRTMKAAPSIESSGLRFA